jgi:hypothetical protein
MELTESENQNNIKERLWEKIEDTTVVIRIRNTKKDRQCNDQKKKGKGTNNGRQNLTH